MRSMHLMVTALLGASTAVTGVPGAAAAAPRTVSAVAAVHRGSYDAGVMTWRSAYLLRAQEVAGEGTRLLALAVAPPDSALATAASAADAPALTLGRDVGGSTTGLLVNHCEVGSAVGSGADLCRVEVVTRQRVGEGAALLTPALAAGSGVQMVVVTGTDGAAFTPDPTLGLMHEVRHFRAQDVSESQRRECERLLGADADRALMPLFLRASGPVAAAGGLQGKLATLRGQRRVTTVAALAGGGVIVGLLVVVYRRLAARARLERAYALLDRTAADDWSAVDERQRGIRV